jgi:hypothetical protein
MLRMQEIAFPGFKFQKFPDSDPPRDSCVVCRPHGYPSLLYYLTERSLFKNGKILKKGPDKISSKVVYVYCVSKAVGQTNTVPPPPPPPPQTRLGSYALAWVDLLQENYLQRDETGGRLCFIRQRRCIFSIVLVTLNFTYLYC